MKKSPAQRHWATFRARSGSHSCCMGRIHPPPVSLDQTFLFLRKNVTCAGACGSRRSGVHESPAVHTTAGPRLLGTSLGHPHKSLLSNVPRRAQGGRRGGGAEAQSIHPRPRDPAHQAWDGTSWPAQHHLGFGASKLTPTRHGWVAVAGARYRQMVRAGRWVGAG
jgi:hypothetical protein